jgi:hypothetical protein
MPRADTGLREPSSSGSVVLRGTRSVIPDSTQKGTDRTFTAPPALPPSATVDRTTRCDFEEEPGRVGAFSGAPETGRSLKPAGDTTNLPSVLRHPAQANKALAYISLLTQDGIFTTTT